MPFVDADSEIHTCSYFCDRPECIKRQRDELRDIMHVDAGSFERLQRENRRLHEWLAGSMGGKPDEQ